MFQVTGRLCSGQVYHVARRGPPLNKGRPTGLLWQMRCKMKPVHHFPVSGLRNAPLRYIDGCVSEVVPRVQVSLTTRVFVLLSFLVPEILSRVQSFIRHGRATWLDPISGVTQLGGGGGVARDVRKKAFQKATMNPHLLGGCPMTHHGFLGRWQHPAKQRQSDLRHFLYRTRRGGPQCETKTRPPPPPRSAPVPPSRWARRHSTLAQYNTDHKTAMCIG